MLTCGLFASCLTVPSAVLVKIASSLFVLKDPLHLCSRGQQQIEVRVEISCGIDFLDRNILIKNSCIEGQPLIFYLQSCPGLFPLFLTSICKIMLMLTYQLLGFCIFVCGRQAFSGSFFILHA